MAKIIPFFRPFARREEFATPHGQPAPRLVSEARPGDYLRSLDRPLSLTQRRELALLTAAERARDKLFAVSLIAHASQVALGPSRITRRSGLTFLDRPVRLWSWSLAVLAFAALIAVGPAWA